MVFLHLHKEQINFTMGFTLTRIVNSKPFTCTTLVITWIFKEWKHGTKDGWTIVLKQIQSFVFKVVDQSWECVRLVPLTRLFCAGNFQLMDVKTLVVAK